MLLRLSTVRKADSIIVLQEGKVVERGTHEELMGKRGVYYNLVRNQTKEMDDIVENEEDDVAQADGAGEFISGEC